MEGATMKRDFKTIATIGLLVGCLAIGGAGAFALASGNSYQDFKNTVINTASSRNMTVTADVAVNLDGVEILAGSLFTQLDEENRYSSINLQANGQSIDTEQSTSASETIMRRGDDYFSLTPNSQIGRQGFGSRGGRGGGKIGGFSGGSGRGMIGKNAVLEPSPSAIKLGETVADLLIGDLKNHFTSNGNTISVSIDGAQIPELLNVAVSAMAEMSESKPDRPIRNNGMLGDAFPNIPITQNVTVKSVNITADVAEDIFSTGNITIVFAGQDSDGNNHDVELTMNVKISEVGTTTPATIDTTGKTITKTPM
jgi:hypothetical protein